MLEDQNSNNNKTPEVSDNSSSVPRVNKKSKVNLYLILILIFVLVLGTLGWFKFLKNSPVVKGLSASNQKILADDIAISAKSTAMIEQTANIGDSAKPYKGLVSVKNGFSDIVNYAVPAVVNISATKMIKTSSLSIPENLINPFLKNFFDQFRPPEKKVKSVSLGSGFIVRSDGFVVTNFHVIEGGQNIIVTTHDGKRRKAKLYAFDSLTDIAVLKVDAKNLPSLKFDDSTKIKVGDWVIAIGNPFGLGGTVSAGIVSARGRDINLGLYDDFIQTDAAINRGNSGGPLLDTNGKVIGVNSAIYSTSGGSIGIGFAIPSSLVHNIVAQLITSKKVVRGWLGVQIQSITPDSAKVLNLSKPEGALISKLTPNSPAAKAGLKVGDVIIKLNNIDIRDARGLPKIISVLKPGHKIILKTISKGKTKNITVTLGALPASLEKRLTGSQDKAENTIDSYNIKNIEYKDFGFKAANYNQDIGRIFNLPASTKGVVITAIKSNSQAASVGLTAGWVIMSVNNIKVSNTKELSAILNNKKRSVFLLLIHNPNQNIQTFITLSRYKKDNN